MGLKSKIALLITGLLAMLLFISSEVAARNLKEGEVVRETNRVGDAKLVGGIHDVSKYGIPGISGDYMGGGGSFPGIGGDYIGGGGYIGDVIPGTGIGGAFPNQAYCSFGCCVRDTMGRCRRCCTVSR